MQYLLVPHQFLIQNLTVSEFYHYYDAHVHGDVHDDVHAHDDVHGDACGDGHGAHDACGAQQENFHDAGGDFCRGDSYDNSGTR